MKYIFLVLMLCGCSSPVVGKGSMPSGEEVFNALFKNLDKNLRDEPLCRAEMTLREQLALSLSVAHESQNTTTIESHCSPSKHEVKPDQTIDIWDCTVQLNENDTDGNFISSSTYVFGLTKNHKEFVEGSLRCR